MEEIIKSLNEFLCNLEVMNVKLQNYHWNVTGKGFFLTHEKLEEYYDELLKAIENGDFSAFENKGFIKDIDPDEVVVDFSCGGAGVGSGTSYVGFYYTTDNDMTAVWCAPSSASLLTPSGNGFEWQESNGDNWYYTEHICGNFYYYEASF